MKPLSDHDVAEVLAEVQALGRLMGRDFGRAVTLARDFAAVGFPSSTIADGQPRGGGVSRPTERQALRLYERGDETAEWPGLLAERSEALSKAMVELLELVASITSHAGDPDRDADGKVRRPALGAGHCQACDYNASGVPGDRLRGGLCDADRKRFERNRARWDFDRRLFIRERRLELGLERGGPVVEWKEPGDRGGDTVPPGHGRNP